MIYWELLGDVVMSTSLSMGAVENDRKHDDLCVGSMGIRPMDQQRTS